MSFIGTHLEYIEVTRHAGGEVCKSVDIALHIPVLKADPDVIKIVSAETGEVFFARRNGITTLM